MTQAKVLSFRTVCDTKQRLVKAAGKIIAQKGFSTVTPDTVAAAAGVKRRLIFHHFDGLDGLVRAFSQSQEFWPPAAELIDGDEAVIKAMTGEQQIATFFKRYALALLKRPQTLEILAWETVERNAFSRCLEEVRVRTALEFFELLHEDIPEDIDLSAIVLVLAAAVSFIAMRSRVSRSWGGIDLHSEKGWKRIEDAIDLLMQGTLATAGG